MYMRELEEEGVAVIPFPKEIRERFNVDTFLSEMPEFKHPVPCHHYVMGAFGTLGNPSSYHHPEIRRLRLQIFNHMVTTHFRAAHTGKYIQCLPDRFCIRRPGTSICKDSWHRDSSNRSKNGTLFGSASDIIYGGWVNLDEHITHSFSCVPGTHKSSDAETSIGFAKVSAEKQKEYKAVCRVYSVPPGHMLVFHELLVHEVFPGKITDLSFRLFMKYRISDSDATTLFCGAETIDQVVADQDVFRVSMTQIPPMYSPMHSSLHRTQLVEFSQHVVPECRDSKTGWVRKVMPSLREARLPLFPAYADEEVAILKMQRL